MATSSVTNDVLRDSYLPALDYDKESIKHIRSSIVFMIVFESVNMRSLVIVDSGDKSA